MKNHIISITTVIIAISTLVFGSDARVMSLGNESQFIPAEEKNIFMYPAYLNEIPFAFYGELSLDEGEYGGVVFKPIWINRL